MCVPSSVGSVLKLRPEASRLSSQRIPHLWTLYTLECWSFNCCTCDTASSGVSRCRPCNIRGISIRRPEAPRSRTSPGGLQKHSFPWNSRGVRAQGHPECDRDVWAGDICLRPPRCFARGLELWNLSKTSTFLGNRGSMSRKGEKLVKMGVRPIGFANATFKKRILFD